MLSMGAKVRLNSQDKRVYTITRIVEMDNGWIVGVLGGTPLATSEIPSADVMARRSGSYYYAECITPYTGIAYEVRGIQTWAMRTEATLIPCYEQGALL